VPLDSIARVKKATRSKGTLICAQTSTMVKEKVGESSQTPSLPKKSSRTSSSNAPSITKGVNDAYH